ncbi:flagellar biosynthesis protein FlhF [Lachnospiraceae bacterium ZAX-1]
MTIKKFEGKTEEEAIAKAKEEFGAGTVIMNVKAVKSKGIFKSLKGATYEVTAAMEEEERAMNPAKALMSPLHARGNINVLADEQISVPGIEKYTAKQPANPKGQANLAGQMSQGGQANPAGQMSLGRQATPVAQMSLGEQLNSEAQATPERRKENLRETNTNGLEEKLESLQSLLEKKLVPSDIISDDQPLKENAAPDENFAFLKMIYSTMLENEIDEKYANQILDEVEKIMRNGYSVDFILSNIYQKMILKFGQPQAMEHAEKKPKIVFFIGPTGVGKTTTIAKIASKYKVEYGKKIAMLTADTYRIAAAEQLRTYANILDTPLSIIYSPEELNEAIENVLDYDYVLVDTAGFSHRNNIQRDDIKYLIDNVDKKYEKEVYLVLSATTKYRDLTEIADTYKEITNFKMIFTKLDETTSYGNIFNMKMYTGAELSYATYGQNVPEDIEVFNTQKTVKLLLGGK